MSYVSHQSRPKDPIIGFRSVIRGFNSKVDALNPQGGTRVQLTMGGDKTRGNQAIDELIALLTQYKDNPRGVKMDVHISKKQHEGRTFESAYMFLRPVQDMQGATAGGPVRYVPVQQPEAPQGVEQAVQNFKAQQIRG